MNGDSQPIGFKLRRWRPLVFAVLAIKMIFFGVDAHPGFFWGDSAVYVWTAVKHSTPPDRSFTYGFFIRLFALPFHSLKALVFWQAIASGVSAIALAVMSVEVLEIPYAIAFATAILFAVEPLQLWSERFVMAECFSTLAFVLMLAAWMAFIRRPRIALVLAAQAAGILLVSLRFAFLPLVTLLTIVGPILAEVRRRAGGGDASKHQPTEPAAPVPSAGPDSSTPDSAECAERPPAAGARLEKDLSTGFRSAIVSRVGYLLLSLSAFGVLHEGYKHYYGYRGGRPAGYFSWDGFFLLAAASPLVNSRDTTDPGLGAVIDRPPRVKADHYGARDFDLWSPGGLIARIRDYYGDDIKANHVAHAIAIHAIFRDPAGFAALVWRNYSLFWDRGYVALESAKERGVDNSPPPVVQQEVFRQLFHIPAKTLLHPDDSTVVRRWQAIAWPWYLLLAHAWLLTLIPIAVTRGVIQKLMVVNWLCAASLSATAIVLATEPTPRYFQAVVVNLLLAAATTMTAAMAATAATPVAPTTIAATTIAPAAEES